jgi:O-antigen ligase
MRAAVRTFPVAPVLMWRRRPRVRLVGAVSVTVALGWVVGGQLALFFVGGSPLPFLLAAPVVVAAGLLILKGPEWCIAALVGMAVLGLYRYSVPLGYADLRVTDAGYLLVLLGVLVAQRRRPAPPASDVGQSHLVLLLVVFGLSLVPVLVGGEGNSTTPVISWLRFVATVSLVWLVPMGIRTLEQRRFVLSAVVVLISLELARALFVAALQGGLGGRLSGANGPNATGLLAALLIVVVLHGRLPERLALRLPALALGVTGLLLTRSIGSIAALSIVLALYGMHVGPSLNERAQRLTRPARLLLLSVGLIALVGVLRPGNLPGDDGFSYSTTAHRLVVGVAGLELFAENPVLGVGWQRSSHPEVIGDPELNERLRERFPDFRQDFFPDRTPTTVHNAYVQVLAESGLVGGAMFVLAALAVARRSSRLVRRLGRDQPEDQLLARCSLLMVLTVMLWWNDNALFGAQPESMSVALALGLMASCRAGPHAQPEDAPAPAAATDPEPVSRTR